MKKKLKTKEELLPLERLPLIYSYAELKELNQTNDAKNLEANVQIQSSLHQTDQFQCHIFYKSISKICKLPKLQINT